MQSDITTEFKELRLHGMASAWEELTTHEGKKKRGRHPDLALACRAFAVV